MRDEGEQGVDGWSEGSAEGGMGMLVSVLAQHFPDTHTNTQLHMDPGGALSRARTHTEKHLHTSPHKNTLCYGIVRASTVSGEPGRGCICISGYYSLIQWTVAMAKLDKIKLSFSPSLPPLARYHTQTLHLLLTPFLLSTLRTHSFSFSSFPTLSSCKPPQNQTHTSRVFVVQLTFFFHLPPTSPLICFT